MESGIVAYRYKYDRYRIPRLFALSKFTPWYYLDLKTGTTALNLGIVRPKGLLHPGIYFLLDLGMQECDQNTSADARSPNHQTMSKESRQYACLLRTSTRTLTDQPFKSTKPLIIYSNGVSSTMQQSTLKKKHEKNVINVLIC